MTNPYSTTFEEIGPVKTLSLEVDIGFDAVREELPDNEYPGFPAHISIVECTVTRVINAAGFALDRHDMTDEDLFPSEDFWERYDTMAMDRAEEEREELEERIAEWLDERDEPFD